MTGGCGFPSCDRPAAGPNRAGAPMCIGHVRVVVASGGSWVNDRHADQGHG